MNIFYRGGKYEVWAKLATEHSDVEFIAECHGPNGIKQLIDELRAKVCDGEIINKNGVLGPEKIAEFFSNEEFHLTL